VPLVAASLISLNLREEHASTGHLPGRYAALQMPLYPSTVSKLLQLTPAVILAQGKRMLTALEYIHSKNYVHMDVKVCPCVWHLASLLSVSLKCCLHVGR
jgi:serine/threonine protein kinase